MCTDMPNTTNRGVVILMQSMRYTCAGGCQHRLQQPQSDTAEAVAEGQGGDLPGVRREGGLCQEGERPVRAVESLQAEFQCEFAG